MKNNIAAFILCFALLAGTGTATAQNQGFGLGIMLNSPTGLSMKGWVDNDLAVDGAISFSLSENSSEFYLHADVLMHSYFDETLNPNTGTLKFYYGGGIRLIWSDVIDDVYAGIRAPLGITYIFEEAPADTFFEFAPTVDFNPSFRFGFAGAVGLRYYLN